MAKTQTMRGDLFFLIALALLPFIAKDFIVQIPDAYYCKNTSSSLLNPFLLLSLFNGLFLIIKGHVHFQSIHAPLFSKEQRLFWIHFISGLLLFIPALLVQVGITPVQMGQFTGTTGSLVFRALNILLLGYCFFEILTKSRYSFSSEPKLFSFLKKVWLVGFICALLILSSDIRSWKEEARTGKEVCRTQNSLQTP